MAGNISLEKGIRGCKIDVGYADRMLSNRNFFDQSTLVCPVWNGYDSTGRSVCPDSFMTKAAGCHSAQDRILVENNIARPRYFEYITLNPAGLEGEIYGEYPDKNMTQWDMMKAKQNINEVNDYTGNFGLQFGSVVRSGCGSNSYKHALGGYNSIDEDRHHSEIMRGKQARDVAYHSYVNKFGI